MVGEDPQLLQPVAATVHSYLAGTNQICNQSLQSDGYIIEVGQSKPGVRLRLSSRTRESICGDPRTLRRREVPEDGSSLAAAGRAEGAQVVESALDTYLAGHKPELEPVLQSRAKTRSDQGCRIAPLVRPSMRSN